MTHPAQPERTQALLTGTLINVGTPETADPIGFPRILIRSTEDAIAAVKTLPVLKPVVVMLEEHYAQQQERIARLEAGLKECDKQRQQLIDGCCHAETTIGEYIDKHLDEDPPEGSSGSPQYAELRNLQAHLSGTCIGDDGEYMPRDQFKALLQPPTTNK